MQKYDIPATHAKKLFAMSGKKRNFAPKINTPMKTFRLSLFLSLPLILTACIKDAPKNDECDILSAWVQGQAYEPYFYQPTQMRIDDVPSNTNTILFLVRSLDSLPPMPVHFTLTPGATIEPANGSLQDFSQGHVTYTVRSEDGQWTRSYRVGFEQADMSATHFSFEHVDVETASNGSSYHVFYEEDGNGERHNYWATGNAGVGILHPDWTPLQFPTYSTPEGHSGRGVCLNTQLTGDLGAMMNKPIAAGNLFLGNFNVNTVLVNALEATEFGIPIDRQPMRVSGWYKYRPGDTFTNANMETVPGRVDQAHIYAVFFRNHDDEGNPVVIDGTNTLTSPYIVSKAQLIPPATDEWTFFEMDFTGGVANQALLDNMGYSFTIVFSSSLDGDVFEGAVGSTLYIDEVEVSF